MGMFDTGLFEGTHLYATNTAVAEKGTQKREYVGMNAEQQAWVDAALTATGLPLGNVTRVVYRELEEDDAPLTALAQYISRTGEMILYPPFFKNGMGTVHGKRALMSVLIHEGSHAADPLINKGRQGELVSQEVMDARGETIMLLGSVIEQSKITGLYLDGAEGYHHRLQKLFDEMLSLNRIGEASNDEVMGAYILLQIELFAIATDLSLLSHGHLVKLEAAQKKFYENPDNESLLFDNATGTTREFKPFVAELDRLLAIIIGFGSIAKLKQQRQKISAFVEGAPNLVFAPPQRQENPA